MAKYKTDTGSSSLHVVLSSTSDADTQRVDQLLQAQWKQAGIDHDDRGRRGPGAHHRRGVRQVPAGHLPDLQLPRPGPELVLLVVEHGRPVGSVSINFSHYKSPTIDADLATGRKNADFATRKTAYDSLIKEINEKALNIWLTATPYSLIAAKKVHGLRQASQVPFGNFQPKTWLADLWVSQS